MDGTDELIARHILGNGERHVNTHNETITWQEGILKKYKIYLFLLLFILQI